MISNFEKIGDLSALTKSTIAPEEIAAFSERIKNERPEAVVESSILTGSVRVFGEKDTEYSAVLKKHLADELKIPEASVLVVGSAKTGFSLSPKKFPNVFSDESDVDVAVVSAELFDRLWLALVRVSYFAWWAKANRKIVENLRDLRKGVAYGHMMPAACQVRDPITLRTDRELSTVAVAWARAFRGMGRYEPFFSHNVKGRLYRSYDHALAYHAQGIEQVRQQLRGA